MINAQNWMGLNDSHILNISPQHGLVKDAKCAFESMQRAAQKDNIDIQLASSFRSFDRQLSIWQKKWSGVLPVNDFDSQPVDMYQLSELEKIHAIMLWSALPGASRHHWGTDLDVYDKQAIEGSGQRLQLISSEYQESGPCYDLHCWLEDNAQQFDFYRPYQTYTGGVAPEAWHLSYAPISKQIIDQLQLEELAKQLSNIDIGGKVTILEYLSELFERYTLNGIR